MINNVIKLLKEIILVNPNKNKIVYSKKALESFFHGSNYNPSIQSRINVELKNRNENFRLENNDDYCVFISRNLSC
ncbi:MAG: hypothetical protein KQ78_00831 [Candidatus Izimaplasma bacterium HR2]|nr:MAG: hypothetical protein KQ78_00831 [Candidatus Izimaplasma bacterium HR2]